MKSIKYTPHLIYIAIIVALCFYLLKSCGGSHADGAFAKLRKEKSEDSAHDKAMIGRYIDTNKQLRSDKILDSIKLAESQNDVLILKGTVDKLIVAHEKEPAPIPFDSTSSIVSNKYITQCADCFASLKDGERKVGKLINDVAELNHKNDQLISLKDKHIDSLDMALAAKEHFYNSLANLYQAATKPRYHGFMGVEAEYSQPYKSAGVWLMLQDKRGRMYGIQGGVNSLNTWYLGGRAGMKVF